MFRFFKNLFNSEKQDDNDIIRYYSNRLMKCEIEKNEIHNNLIKKIYKYRDLLIENGIDFSEGEF